MERGPILICYDGSEEARHAITVAAELIGVQRRAVVVDVAQLEVAADAFAAFGSGAGAVEQRLLRDALARAGEGVELARGLGFRALGRADLAAPTWRGLVQIADEIGAGLIVIGSRSLRGLSALVERSVSRDVAAHAGRPVLVVPRSRLHQENASG